MSLGLASAASPLAATAAAADLAIVVNPDTPVSKLTFAELRQVFLGDKQYWPNVPVVLLIRAPTSAERDAVLNAIYQMQEAQFKQYWIAKIFKADLTSPPKIVYSNEAAISVVASIPWRDRVHSQRTTSSWIRISRLIRIDDRLPGEPGYRLHLTANDHPAAAWRWRSRRSSRCSPSTRAFSSGATGLRTQTVTTLDRALQRQYPDGGGRAQRIGDFHQADVAAGQVEVEPGQAPPARMSSRMTWN